MSEKNILFGDIIDDLSTNYKGENISEKDAVRIANRILDVSHKIVYKGGETPIIEIIENFGMEVYRTKELDKLYPQDNVSGVIYINGRTQEIYHVDKIIFTSSFDPIGHQRFVMAHELGHYLFDYLCSSRYVDNEDFFEETYKKGEAIIIYPKKRSLIDLLRNF